MQNPLLELGELNQSVWLDNIHRDMLSSGELARLITHDGLKGITSNPTIFQKAIAGSRTYDSAIIRILADPSMAGDSRRLFFRLAIEDIQKAADMLKTVYESSRGRDGYVSIEVSPDLAYDTQRTVAEAKQLFAEVNRPNCMIKVPATQAGIPAIEALIGEGINVNATLLFSVARYEEVVEAYIRGLERRVANKQPIDHIASVASFFISRVDSLVDRLLEERVAQATSKDKNRYSKIKGSIAIANAKLAYRAYKKLFFTKRFGDLRQHGSQTQRLLWASTGTKNPNYSDVLYIEQLVGPDTVNTMPPSTLDAFRDHGRVHTTLEENLELAAFAITTLEEAGIDLKIVTDQLEKEGVKAFENSFNQLLATIEQKLEQARSVN